MRIKIERGCEVLARKDNEMWFLSKLTSPFLQTPRTQLDTTILMVAESLKMVNVTVETDSGTKVVTMANYETVSFVYEWAGEYFDAIQELPGTRPYSVTHIRIYNAHFIAMANFVNNKGWSFLPLLFFVLYC